MRCSHRVPAGRAAVLAAMAVLLAACNRTPPQLMGPDPRWYPYEAPDRSFSVMFPSQPPRANLGEYPSGSHFDSFDLTTQYSVAVNDYYRFQSRDLDAAAVWRNYFRGMSLSGGFETGAITKDSIVHLGKLEGRWGRIAGRDSVTHQPRTLVYRFFFVDRRVFLVWATSLRGQPLSRDTDRFIESLRIPAAD